MRILFPLVGDSIGGSHRSTVLLIKQLQKSKINIEVLIHQKKSFFINFLEEHDIAYHYLEVNELAGETPKVYEIIFAIFRNYFLFRKFLKKKKIDIVHGNDLRINLSWSLITILSGRKYVWHQRTLMSDSIIWNLINFMSSHFIAISNFVMHSLPSIISDSRKSVVNNPFSREHHFDNTMKGNLIHELGINDGSKIVCYVGKLVKTKGIIELIESMQLVNQYIPSVLIVAGSGEKKFMSKLGQIILKKNLQKKIIFLGFVNEPEKYIAISDLLVAPGKNEGFGRTIIEAMLVKTPVIASKSGAHTEIIENNFNGLLYEHGNRNDLYEKINTLLSSEVLYNEVQKNAYDFVNSSYTEKEHLVSVMSIYKKLL